MLLELEGRIKDGRIRIESARVRGSIRRKIRIESARVRGSNKDGRIRIESARVRGSNKDGKRKELE